VSVSIGEVKWVRREFNFTSRQIHPSNHRCRNQLCTHAEIDNNLQPPPIVPTHETLQTKLSFTVSDFLSGVATSDLLFAKRIKHRKKRGRDGKIMNFIYIKGKCLRSSLPPCQPIIPFSFTFFSLPPVTPLTQRVFEGSKSQHNLAEFTCLPFLFEDEQA
jgi:hypothetical protein